MFINTTMTLWKVPLHDDAIRLAWTPEKKPGSIADLDMKFPWNIEGVALNE